MRCPKCGTDNFELPGPCFRCRFSGDAALLEEWIGLDFLLKEAVTWSEIPEGYRGWLRSKYGKRRQAVEIQLGVRQPPLNPEVARLARQELTDIRTFYYSSIIKWERQGWLTAASAEKLRQESNDRIEQLQEQLVDAPPEVRERSYSYHEVRHRQLRYQLHLLEALRERNRLAGLTVYEEARAAITADLHQVEIQLGLRQPPPKEKTRPEPVQPPAAEQPPPAPRKPTTTTQPVSSPPPRKPFTWDRVWETLLSERTLRAILFLGATLLFAAAVSLVIWNWGTFPPWLQVTFLASFTALFYGLGWYVRTRMRLVVSGIALSGVASLLVPLDFYAFYLSGGFLGLLWRDVWLLTSAVCLVAYLLTVYLIQAEFFGYLVGLAAASLLAASLRFIGVESVWWPMAMAGLALLLALTAVSLPRMQTKAVRRWRVLITPYWHLAVVGATAVLALSTGWGLTGLVGGDHFLTSLAVSWWLGGAAYLLAVNRFQMRLVAMAAALSFPVAAFLTQQQLYKDWEISSAWYALGWALLVPLYLYLGRRLQAQATAETNQDRADLTAAYSQTSLVGGVLLMIVAFGWALGDSGAMALVHLVLALAMVMAARLWERPNYLALTSLFLMSSTAGLVSTTGGTVGHLGLGWALLAVSHIAAALRLSSPIPGSFVFPGVTRFGKSRSFIRDKSDFRQTQGAGSHNKSTEQESEPSPYAMPVFRAGWVIGALALWPPFFTFERSILTYALGNWIAINGWLAMLVHEKRLRLDQFWPVIRGRQRRLPALTFQWLAALLLPLWLGLVWTNGRPAGTRMGLAFLALGWLILILGGRLRRLRWDYGRPWFIAAQICTAVAVLASPIRFDQPAAAVLFLLASAFYVHTARILHNRWWLVWAGLSFAISTVLGLDWLTLPLDPLIFVMSLVVLAYIAGPLLLHRYLGLSRRNQEPLKVVAYIIGAIIFLLSLLRLVTVDGRTDALLLWMAATQAVLALAAGIFAWSENEEGFGHIAAWLGVISGGLIAAAFSQGRGSSAAKAAVLAILYITAERLLCWAALKWGSRWRPLAGELWVLFRRPILTAGWGVSFITIFLALGRNLIILGGGRMRETWAIIGLLLITGLYLISSWLYRRYPRMSGRRVWWAAVLIFFPWTLLTHMGWYLWDSPQPVSRYAISWALLALGQLVIATVLTAPVIDRRYTRPFQVVAHVLLPFALLWGIGNSATSSVTVGLAVVFYLLALFADRLTQLRLGRLLKLPDTPAPKSRFLYPAAFLTPVWGVYLLDYFLPRAAQSTFGVLLLGFSLPFLLLGHWVGRRERAFTRPLYLAAYGTAVIGTFLTTSNQTILIGAFLFDAFLGIISARLFDRPYWLYVTVVTLPAAWLLTLDQWGVPSNRFGWGLVGLSQLYLAAAWWLSRWHRSKKERLVQQISTNAVPFLAGSFALVVFGIVVSSQDQLAFQIGYSAAALVLVQMAVWLKQPVLSAAAAGLITVPYLITVSKLDIGQVNYGLALWPFIVTYLLLGYGLDKFVGFKRAFATPEEDEPGILQPFPWDTPEYWPHAALGRLLQWWALPFYAIAFAFAVLSTLLSSADPARLTITLLMTAVIFGWATAYFRLRGWLLAAVASLQLAVIAGYSWIGWWERPSQVALLFLPVTFATAFIGLLVEWGRSEGRFAGRPGQVGRLSWSRPFYLILALDVLVGQMISMNFGSVFNGTMESVWITLGHALLMTGLAVWWASDLLAALVALLGFFGLIQLLIVRDVNYLSWPSALALLAVGYGLAAYFLRYLRNNDTAWVRRPEIKIWEQPLLLAGWSISSISLLAMAAFGLNVILLVVRAVFWRPFMTPNDVMQVQMIVAVLSLVGLFYLAAAVVDRKPRLGYLAMGMLLVAWGLEWALVWNQREVQYYAVPAGAYLLLVGYLEWHHGSRALARWIDRLGLLLLLGTSFWQSLGPVGWSYALLMGFEGLMITWWGSTRRQRRFLYAGVVGVTVDVIGQLIQPLLTATDRWIVFGIVGVFLVSLAILVERRLENVLALTKDVRRRLEDWE